MKIPEWSSRSNPRPNLDPTMDRRDFLRGSMGAAVLAARSADSFAQSTALPSDHSWDAGQVRHLLPTVSDTRILIKASFTKPLTAAPSLRVGGSTFRGSINDTEGSCWQFHATGLQPERKYQLSLIGAGHKTLCQGWELSTFPGRTSRPERFRVLFFTCAGGPDSASGSGSDALTSGNLPTATRNRLLRRALSFQPQAAVANGDHVYWDLLAPVGKTLLGMSPEALAYSPTFNRSQVVLGGDNETILKRVAGPQIVPVYGTDFRSTPVFFMQDDHDYFDNDEAT